MKILFRLFRRKSEDSEKIPTYFLPTLIISLESNLCKIGTGTWTRLLHKNHMSHVSRSIISKVKEETDLAKKQCFGSALV
jgi:hypothetical protein